MNPRGADPSKWKDWFAPALLVAAGLSSAAFFAPSKEQFETFLQSGIRISTPLLFAALGALAAQKSGLINIGLEGTVLAGAFAGFAATVTTGSLFLGVIAGICAGAVWGVLFGLFCISLRNDQIVTGAALNFLAFGLTGLLYKVLYGSTGTTTTVASFEELPIPGLSSLPILGPPLFSQSVLTYLAIGAAILLAILASGSRLGFHLEAVGEHPRAADAAGIPVSAVRWAASVFEGSLGGLAGAALSLAAANTFTEGMSNGRGYIAIAIVIFGRWNPIGVLGGATFFGAATALQLMLQATDVEWLRSNYPYLQMLPYLLTLVVLAAAVGGARQPSGLGRHYHRE